MKKKTELNAKWYVSATDKLFSNYGEHKGKTVKIIVECDDLYTAIKVEASMEREKYMSNVKRTNKKPTYSASKYDANYYSEKECPFWTNY